jgi:hypothetical protein
MSRITLVSLNTLILAGILWINALAGSGIIGGKTIGEISRQYDTLITPAGYAFSVWGLIYFLLTAFVVFQWIVLIKKEYGEIIDSTGMVFFISGLANIGWLFLWLNDLIGFSVLAMLVLLISLIILVFRLKLEIWDAPVRIIMFVWWPFVFYLGWIIIATVANIAAFLTSLSWDGSPLSPQLWTIILIIIATAIYSYLVFTRNLRESALVGVWAFVAVAARQGSTHSDITITAITASVVLLAEIMYHGYRNRKTSPFEKMRRGEF